MRNPRSKSRRKKKNGCIGGFMKFLIFILIIILFARFLVNKYQESDLSTKIKKNQYPIKYEHFVEKYSAQYNLDKYLVYAVIRTESRFDVYAVSSAEAKGLMQLTDETGSECAAKIGLTRYTNDMLFDPETNIRLGCYYLSRLIKSYKGNIETALAAYNGGPGNVQKWLESGDTTDSDVNLDNIPFAETRSYVKRVTEARQMYKSLYDIQK